MVCAAVDVDVVLVVELVCLFYVCVYASVCVYIYTNYTHTHRLLTCDTCVREGVCVHAFCDESVHGHLWRALYFRTP